MARTYVIVDGITLSRQQVNTAMTELMKPEFDFGDIVQEPDNDKEYVVIDPTSDVADYLNHIHGKHGKPESGLRVFDGRDTWTKSVSKLVLVRKLASGL